MGKRKTTTLIFDYGPCSGIQEFCQVTIMEQTRVDTRGILIPPLLRVYKFNVKQEWGWGLEMISAL